MTPAPENSSGAGVFVVGTEGSDPCPGESVCGCSAEKKKS